MSLGIKTQKTYINIKEGKIFLGSTPYDFIEGTLKGIELRDREFKGEAVKYWYIDIKSSGGDLFSLALHYNSGVAKSLFLSLASAPDFLKELRIEPYLSGEFTKINTYLGGERLLWKVNKLPDIEEVTVGSKIVKDDSKRMEFIEGLVSDINSKL
jgi:hypothetical protein